MTLDRNKLRELSMKVKNLPWRSEREAESPDIRDMEGTLLAMGIWPLHDPTPKAERQAEIQTYDIVEYLVLAANTAPALLDELEAAEGDKVHLEALVDEHREAWHKAEQRVRELTQEVEVARRGEAFASDSLFKQYQQSGECSRFTYSGWIGEQFRRLSVMETALRNAKLQIEYLHEKFEGTGSGNAVLEKIEKALEGSNG